MMTALTDSAEKLAAAFEERRPGSGDLVKENLAELADAGIFTAGTDLAENLTVLRILGHGCGATAFAAAAQLAEDRPEWGGSCDAAVFLGLAERAYELAVRAAKDREVTRLPGTQFAIARMRGDLASMTALLTRYEGESPIPRYYVGMVSERVVSAAYDIIGGGDGPIGRIWQDLKTGPVLPYSSDRALEHIGKAAFCIAMDETPRWL